MCVFSLSVQMAEDTDVLEFTAAASDTLDAASHTQVHFKQTICIQIKDKLVMTFPVGRGRVYLHTFVFPFGL